MTGNQVIEEGKKCLMTTYAQPPVVLVRGEGPYVWDAEGKRYLDFVGGIAVNLLGHCHPKVVEAIKEQAATLLHCSNLYWFEPPVKLAQKLTRLSGLERAFFCNSGTEANEAAIKLVRKYAFDQGRQESEIIAFYNSFHGRTIGALAATGQEKFWKGFAPLPGGFRHLPFNDLEALRKAVDERTSAIFVEPVQGEGGIYPASQELMDLLAELRRKNNLLLVFDEVQCGLGRTGKMFAFEHYGVKPDVLVLAKGLGGGLPIGALLAREGVAATFQPGTHGSTFGGNPVPCEAACAVLDVLEEENLPAKAAELGSLFRKKLEGLRKKFAFITEVREKGLMLGVHLDRPGKEIVDICRQKGLLVNCTAERVIRFLPPLVITNDDLEAAVAILEEAFAEFAVS